MITKLKLAVEIRPNAPKVRYDLAVAYALSGRKRKALNALQEAVRSGFADVTKIMEDTDLASLREEKDFRKIIESLNQKK